MDGQSCVGIVTPLNGWTAGAGGRPKLWWDSYPTKWVDGRTGWTAKPVLGYLPHSMVGLLERELGRTSGGYFTYQMGGRPELWTIFHSPWAAPIRTPLLITTFHIRPNLWTVLPHLYKCRMPHRSHHVGGVPLLGTNLLSLSPTPLPSFPDAGTR
jgi:hypothetical protein